MEPFISVLPLILLGLIPAAIARSKGRSFGWWWLYGSVLFVIALPHALLLRPLNDIPGALFKTKSDVVRKCLQCNYVGGMGTWLRNNSLPQLIAIVGLFFFLIPGIIFIAWAWGKHKCPACGAVGKNVLPSKSDFKDDILVEGIDGKTCPYCAEIVKVEAVVCRYCHRDLPQGKKIK